MIDEKRLAELRNSEKLHTHWIIDDKCMYDEFMGTIEKLLRVAKAAKAANVSHFSCWNKCYVYGCMCGKKTLQKALNDAGLEEETK